MRIRSSVPWLRVLLVTVLAIASMFVVSTWGFAAWHRAQSVPEGDVPLLPSAVDTAPPSVATTDDYGPLGVISMAYAGTEVEDGLTGEVEHPWLAISAYTGDYRALSAPHLPSATVGALAVSAAGDRLAWASGSGVVVYDPVTDETRTIDLQGATGVGSFSDDGTMLTVHADGLLVLDLESDEVVAEEPGVPEDVTHRSAWRADGSAVDVVVDDQLVTLPVSGGRRSTQPTTLGGDADLAWSPTGEQLVAMQEVSGINRLFAATLGRQGRVGTPKQVLTEGISLERLIGFSSDNTVSVSAYLLESGAVERVLDIRLDGGPPIDLVTLPSPGDNWVGSQTLSVTSEALAEGSTDYGSQLWPWSHRARLATCVVLGLFGLGLWLTRPPRNTRRARR